MNIHARILHTPYAKYLAMAFPEHHFYFTEWNSNFRDLPSNARVSEPKVPVHVVIDAHPDNDLFLENAVNIHLFHLETDLFQNRELIEKIIDESDFSVVVSEHKLRTLCDLSFRPDVFCIPFGIDEKFEAVPAIGRVGCVHNHLNEQHMNVWGPVVEAFPDALMIGYGNDLCTSVKYEPKSEADFFSVFSTLDVFVHVVVGDAFGLAPCEALSFGIPIVTGFNRDLDKTMISGWNCYVARGRGDDYSNEIVHYVKTLVFNRSIRNFVSTNSRFTSERVFSLKAFRDKWGLLFSSNV